jgi:hypothetical protein
MLTGKRFSVASEHWERAVAAGAKGNPTGDMSNYVDREAVFRGGADQAAQSLAENAAGSSRPKCCAARLTAL